MADRSDSDISSNDDLYHEEYCEGADSIISDESGNTTYSHRIGSRIDIQKPNENNTLFDEFTEKGSPVYIFAVTNNKGDFNETTRDICWSA